MSLDSVTVVIRSVGERTEALCKKLIMDQGVDEAAIFVVNEAPFSKALKVGFEIGLLEGRPWLYCVDADVLSRPFSVIKMLRHGDVQPLNVCEIQGFMLDKFFGGARTGGVHLYRVSLLDKAIKRIPSENTVIRPETCALRAMQRDGFPWKTVQENIGLHDFEQSYEDIFRKSFVHAHKHLSYTDSLIPYWRSQSNLDLDYVYALSGFGAGIQHFEEVAIDVRAEYFLNKRLDQVATVKAEIDLTHWDLDKVESIIKGWQEPQEYWSRFAGGQSGTVSARLVERTVNHYKRLRGAYSKCDSARKLLGWFLINIGNRISH